MKVSNEDKATKLEVLEEVRAHLEWLIQHASDNDEKSSLFHVEELVLDMVESNS